MTRAAPQGAVLFFAGHEVRRLRICHIDPPGSRFQQGRTRMNTMQNSNYPARHAPPLSRPAEVTTPVDEAYLDLLKRAITRALFMRPVERHTWRAGFPGKRQMVQVSQRLLAKFNLEVVRLVRTTRDDYLESGHAARNRAEDSESML